MTSVGLAPWLVALLLVGAVAGTPHSFHEVRARIFDHPLVEPTPPPFGFLPELSLLMEALSGRLSKRLAATLVNTDDFKDSVLKPIHRQGICADAAWDMEVATSATGLFESGTHVNGIVRFASGTNRAEYSRVLPRNFGIAIKLFPGSDADAPVHSANAFVFDQYGLAGEVRPGFLVKNAGAPDITFSNVTNGTRLLNRMGNFVLGRFDKPALSRPLYQLAEVNGAGQAVFAADMPARMVLVAQHPERFPVPVPEDYRRELAAYAPGTLKFDVLIAMDAADDPTRVGTLTILNTVLSAACDAELHFAHVPWRKTSPSLP